MKKIKITLGITGTIGALDIHNYLLFLEKYAEVNIIVTTESKKIISVDALRKINQNIFSDMWDDRGIPHTYLGRDADVFLILPASANTISKIAHGLADNLLCASALNYTGQILFAPNMNEEMWNNSIIQDNVAYLKKKGHIFLNKEKEAYITCKKTYEFINTGLPTPQEISTYIYNLLSKNI